MYVKKNTLKICRINKIHKTWSVILYEIVLNQEKVLFPGSTITYLF